MQSARAPDDAPPLVALLYVSEQNNLDSVAIDAICRQSRDNNKRDGITGLLVFDGQAFCQLVEGPEPAIDALRMRLERDPRHVGMRILKSGPITARRRFAAWRLGYAFSADPEAIARIERSGGNALAEFDRLRPDWVAAD